VTRRRSQAHYRSHPRGKPHDAPPSTAPVTLRARPFALRCSASRFPCFAAPCVLLSALHVTSPEAIVRPLSTPAPDSLSSRSNSIPPRLALARQLGQRLVPGRIHAWQSLRFRLERPAPASLTCFEATRKLSRGPRHSPASTVASTSRAPPPPPPGTPPPEEEDPPPTPASPPPTPPPTTRA